MMKYPATSNALEHVSELIDSALREVVANSVETKRVLQRDAEHMRLLAQDLQPLVTLLREVAFVLKEGCECDDTKQN